jgi:hypothetical protein
MGLLDLFMGTPQPTVDTSRRTYGLYNADQQTQGKTPLSYEDWVKQQQAQAQQKK